MAVPIDNSDLPRLLLRLEQHLPKSLKVYGEVRANLSGNWPGVNFFSDKWPDFNVIITQADPLKTKCPYVNNIHSIYSTDDAALMDMLLKPGIVRWNRRVVFAALDMELCKTIVMAANKVGSTVHIDTVCDWLQADIKSLVVIPVPDDVTMTSMDSSEEMVKAVKKDWQYGQVGAETFIKALIDSFPSRCLLDKDKNIIGYAIGQQYGTLGMLFVRPEYRKRGYGKVIMSQLANIYVQNGEKANVCVEPINSISRRFHEKLGFKFIDFSVGWMTALPKDQTCSCICRIGCV